MAEPQVAELPEVVEPQVAEPLAALRVEPQAVGLPEVVEPRVASLEGLPAAGPQEEESRVSASLEGEPQAVGPQAAASLEAEL